MWCKSPLIHKQLFFNNQHWVMNDQVSQQQLGTENLEVFGLYFTMAYYAIGKVKKQSQAGAEHCNNSTARQQG